jgi:hypothetical protein
MAKCSTCADEARQNDEFCGPCRDKVEKLDEWRGIKTAVAGATTMYEMADAVLRLMDWMEAGT